MSENNRNLGFKDKLDKFFYKIFNPSHIAYTIIFFIEVLILIVLNFLGSTALGDIGLFLATAFSLSFIFLMFIGIYPKLETYLFSKSMDQYKILIFLSIFSVSFIIILMYFLFGSSTQLPIQFLGWDYILPGFYIITYFGWNMAQIFFLKTSFEDISLKANKKILPEVRSNKNDYISVLFLILAISIPIITQLGTFFAFSQFFEPQTPSDPIESLWWFYGWNVAMFCVILIISYRLFSLFIKSKKNDTLNVFSSIFYILIWLIIWFRSFSFINAFRSVTQVIGIDAFRAVIDVLLMILTAILVIKGLGSKTYKIRLFNPNNLAFFLFAFTLIYMEGQIIMITGAGIAPGTYTNQSQVNLVNNFLVLLITLVFYWYYAEYSLKKNGLILKKIFEQEEVIIIVSDFKDYLINSGALDSNRISDSEFQNFLQQKKLKIKESDMPEIEKVDE